MMLANWPHRTCNYMRITTFQFVLPSMQWPQVLIWSLFSTSAPTCSCSSTKVSSERSRSNRPILVTETDKALINYYNTSIESTIETTHVISHHNCQRTLHRPVWERNLWSSSRLIPLNITRHATWENRTKNEHGSDLHFSEEKVK